MSAGSARPPQVRRSDPPRLPGLYLLPFQPCSCVLKPLCGRRRVPQRMRFTLSAVAARGGELCRPREATPPARRHRVRAALATAAHPSHRIPAFAVATSATHPAPHPERHTRATIQQPPCEAGQHTRRGCVRRTGLKHLSATALGARESTGICCKQATCTRASGRRVDPPPTTGPRNCRKMPSSTMNAHCSTGRVGAGWLALEGMTLRGPAMVV